MRREPPGRRRHCTLRKLSALRCASERPSMSRMRLNVLIFLPVFLLCSRQTCRRFSPDHVWYAMKSSSDTLHSSSVACDPNAARAR